MNTFFTSLSHRQKYDDDTGESFSLQLVMFVDQKKEKYLFKFQMCLARNFTRTFMLSKFMVVGFYLISFFSDFASWKLLVLKSKLSSFEDEV